MTVNVMVNSGPDISLNSVAVLKASRASRDGNAQSRTPSGQQAPRCNTAATDSPFFVTNAGASLEYKYLSVCKKSIETTSRHERRRTRLHGIDALTHA
jgi:hypothetical protein